MKLKIKLRNMLWSRSSVNSLEHTSLIPEVGYTLIKWVEKSGKGVLIGGLAMSFYSQPRTTQDVDLLFISKESIPAKVDGFRKHRKDAFEEIETNVEIETVHPDSFNVPRYIFQKVIDTARHIDGFKVASPEALVVLKLYGADLPRREFKDMGDIVNLLGNRSIDITDWNLPEKYISRFNQCKEKLA